MSFKREISIIWFGKAFRYEEKVIKEPKLICLKSPFSTFSTHVIPADIFSVPLLKIGTYISCCMIRGRSICDLNFPFKFLIKPLLFNLYFFFTVTKKKKESAMTLIFWHLSLLVEQNQNMESRQMFAQCEICKSSFNVQTLLQSSNDNFYCKDCFKRCFYSGK